MATNFFNYSLNTSSKGFACLKNKFFRHFTGFLLNSSLKLANIWMRS